MKKYTVIILIFIHFYCSLFSQELIDLLYATSPLDLTKDMYLLEQENVQKLTTYKTSAFSPDYVNRNVLFYEDGIVQSNDLYSYGSDTEGIFEYDSFGRIVQEGIKTEYRYPSNEQSDTLLTQEQYFNGYFATTKYRLLEDGFEKYTKIAKNNSGMTVKYYYDEDILIEIREQDIRANQLLVQLGYIRESEETVYTFVYDGDVLTKIYKKVGNTPETLYWNIHYTDSTITRIENKEDNSAYYFANHDEYGNWQECEYHKNGELHATTVREIEYW